MSNAPVQPPDPEFDDTGVEAGTYGLRQWLGWVLGPLALLATLVLAPPDGLSVMGWRTAGAALLMAIFWICEPIPIPATALLPLILFPALGLGDITQTAAPFANPIIYLFLGGFLIAIAMQRWNLHQRIAINLIGALGAQPRHIILGFLLSSALISMWVSNTATTLMMLPIALSVVHLLPGGAGTARERGSFGSALLLSIAYGATTGGMGTLIGTPPNALLAAYVSNIYGFELGFGQFMLLGVPVVLVALPTVYFVLTRISFRFDTREIPGVRELIALEKARLGPLSRGEFAVAVVFVLTAASWIAQPLLARAIPLVSDTTIAITGGLLLFMIPINLRRGEFVMTWEATKSVPWEVLLLFGGGLSLAGNIERHGLSKYLGDVAGRRLIVVDLRTRLGDRLHLQVVTSDVLGDVGKHREGGQHDRLRARHRRAQSRAGRRGTRTPDAQHDRRQDRAHPRPRPPTTYHRNHISTHI